MRISHTSRAVAVAGAAALALAGVASPASAQEAGDGPESGQISISSLSAEYGFLTDPVMASTAGSVALVVGSACLIGSPSCPFADPFA